jgi:hypothetical protein
MPKRVGREQRRLHARLVRGPVAEARDRSPTEPGSTVP